MAGAPSRYYRGQPCCEGRAPVWDSIYESNGIGRLGGRLTDDELAAVAAVENYGGTRRVGSPAQLAPMEHTNLVGWSRAVMMPASEDAWVAPFDQTLPRLGSFADLPSLENPDLAPGNGLPHHQQTAAFQTRERVKSMDLSGFRILYDEGTGQHHVQIQWCLSCGPDPWEQFVLDAGQTFTEMVPILRGIAMACSYAPVFGTAVSFMINTTTSLMQGENLDAATLDGFGSALPGQPVTGMAFTAARSLLNGESIDRIGIQTALAAIPVDPQLRDVIGSAVEIAYRVVNDEDITDIALEQIREELPESGRKAMDLARRVCEGDDLGDVLSEEALAAARAAVDEGEAAVNSFIAQAGFGSAVDMLPFDLAVSLKTALAARAAEAEEQRSTGTFGSVPEVDVAGNDRLLEIGRQVVESGTKFKGALISEILKADSFAVTVEQFDNLTNVWAARPVLYKSSGPWASGERPLTDAWRRGFTIALGACKGSSARGPGQTAVYQTLAEAGGRDGFDAGQAVSWWVATRGTAQVYDEAQQTHRLLTIDVPPWNTLDEVQNGGQHDGGGETTKYPSASELGLTVTIVRADSPESREPGDMTGVVAKIEPLQAFPGSTVTVTVWN